MRLLSSTPDLSLHSRRGRNGRRPRRAARAAARGPAVLIGSSVVVVILIGVVLFNLDSGPDGEGGASTPETPTVTPGRLDDDELDGDGGGRVGVDRRIEVDRGWIQVADEETGTLSQQYRFARLEPNPAGLGPGWLEMLQPELELYLANDRVMRLSGEKAIARVPERAIESGTLTGDVLIELYEDVTDRALDDDDAPSLVLRTPEARFDNVLGEIVCPGRIDLATTSAEFSGHRLEMLVNEMDGELRHLQVERVDSIRLAHQATAGVDDATGAEPGRADDAGGAATERGQTAARGTGGNAGSNADGVGGAERAEAAKADEGARTVEEPQFYRLTLHDDVRIEQGRSAEQRTATGDRLELIFSLESEGVGSVLTARRSPVLFKDDGAGLANGKCEEPGSASMGPGVAAAVLTAATAQPMPSGDDRASARPGDIAPPAHPMDTMIWCEGGLTITPLDRRPDDLDSRESAQLRLIGSPVRLHDAAEDAKASCGLLLFQSPANRLELVATEDEDLRIEHPQLTATGERFWMQRDGAPRGGFTGAGSMRMESAPGGGGAATLDRDQLDIAWSERVSFAFAANGADEAAGPFSAIRQAVFHGGVDARSNDFRLIETATAGPRSGRASDTGASPALADAGRLRCERLEVNLSPSSDPADRRIVPRQILAQGDVVAEDARQMLWADELQVDLEPEAGEAGPRPTERMDGDGVERILARGAVQLLATRGERVFADELSIDAERRVAELRGGEVLLVDGPNIIDQVAVITVDDAAGEYRLRGPGRFRRFAQALIDGDRNRVAMPTGGATGGAEELRITWREGVVVSGSEIDKPGDDRQPRRVRFDGDVQVLSPEFRLQHADQMIAHLGDEPGGSGSDEAGDDGTRLTAIEATGRVVARSAGEPGEIRCGWVRIDLAQAKDGATIPEQLTARQDVMLTDAMQTIWCDELGAMFEPAPTESEGEAETQTAAAGGEGETLAETDPMGGFTSARVNVTEFTATGNVQVALPDGERVFAGSLRGDQQAGTAILTGSPVLIAGEDFILDEAMRLELDRATGTYSVLGPGRFRSFAGPLELAAADQRIEIPDPGERVTLFAAWEERADYTTDEAAGAGRLDLRGRVHVVSEPTELELNTVDADRLDLLFANAAGEDGATAPSAETSETATATTGANDDEDGLFAGGGRELIEFTARGDATLESRTWLNADRSDRPRVFSISGQHITHNQRAETARVIGSGQLVIRDEWIDEPAADGGERANGDEGGGEDAPLASVSAKGTTAFRWSQALELDPLVDDLIAVSMTGDVEYLHRDMDGGVTTITGQAIEATLRQRKTEGDEAPADADRMIEPGALEIGGNLELRRLYASGSLFVRTPQHDVACDTFDYDLSTGMALVSAGPGRTVSVLSKDTSRPLRAQSVLWDMRKDSITISRGRGGGAP